MESRISATARMASSIPLFVEEPEGRRHRTTELTGHQLTGSGLRIHRRIPVRHDPDRPGAARRT